MAAEGHTDKMASDVEVPMKQRGGTEFLHAEKKNDIHWHSMILAKCLPRPNSGCEDSEAVDSAFQQWQQQYER